MSSLQLTYQMVEKYLVAIEEGAPVARREAQIANSNRRFENLQSRFKRRRREVTRFIERCAAANLDAEKRGEQPTDITKARREFKMFRK